MLKLCLHLAEVLLSRPKKTGSSRWRQSNLESKKKIKTKTKQNLGYAYQNISDEEKISKTW